MNKKDNKNTRKKEVYIIGGPNGSGKTTFVEQFLPKYIKVTNFVNADYIASGLSPLNSTAMDIRAGKLMLELIDEYMSNNRSFGFETTMAGKKWLKFMKDLKKKQYTVHLFFIDLCKVDLSVSRVKYRIEAGGHAIPEDTIRRRYIRAKKNFWNIYRPKADHWYLFDNSGNSPVLVAKGSLNVKETLNKKMFNDFLHSIKGEK